jgi:hypothetical protein
MVIGAGQARLTRAPNSETGAHGSRDKEVLRVRVRVPPRLRFVNSSSMPEQSVAIPVPSKEPQKKKSDEDKDKDANADGKSVPAKPNGDAKEGEELVRDVCVYIAI